MTPLVRSEDPWTELLLDDEHPVANAFALLRLQMAAHEYEEQKELLEAVAARSGDDTFFATFIATRKPARSRVPAPGAKE